MISKLAAALVGAEAWQPGDGPAECPASCGDLCHHKWNYIYLNTRTDQAVMENHDGCYRSTTDGVPKYWCSNTLFFIGPEFKQYAKDKEMPLPYHSEWDADISWCPDPTPAPAPPPATPEQCKLTHDLILPEKCVGCPWTYKGETYYGCAPYNGKQWCSHDATYQPGKGRWSYCEKREPEPPVPAPTPTVPAPATPPAPAPATPSAPAPATPTAPAFTVQEAFWGMAFLTEVLSNNGRPLKQAFQCDAYGSEAADKTSKILSDLQEVLATYPVTSQCNHFTRNKVYYDKAWGQDVADKLDSKVKPAVIAARSFLDKVELLGTFVNTIKSSATPVGDQCARVLLEIAIGGTPQWSVNGARKFMSDWLNGGYDGNYKPGASNSRWHRGLQDLMGKYEDECRS